MAVYQETRKREHESVPFSLPIATKLGTNPITNATIEAYARDHHVFTASGSLLTAEKIFKQTGIATRYESMPSETQEAMARNIALRLIQHAHGLPDAIIVSVTHPQGKNLAYAAWEELYTNNLIDKLPEKSDAVPSPYFEINTACSGFVMALAHLYKHQQYYLGKKVTIIASEGGYRRTLPPLEDDDGENGSLQKTIFSDGAAGIQGRYGIDFVVLKPPVIKHFDDTKVRSLCIPMAPASPPSYTLAIPQPENNYQRMRGHPVFKWTTREIPKAITENIKGTSVKKVILHQANGRITEAQQVLHPRLEFPNHIQNIGNTSSASILFALEQEFKKGLIKRGEEIGLVGFGGGLLIAGAVVKFG